ncbi:hypothetical protein, partial [Nonomuraea angiospora]|uniref:hypothetical protein n=1 Tax=Nonomuraea angiospora TaxID=46172 RepID=UPI0029A2D681
MISPRVVCAAALLAVASLAVPTAAQAKTQLKTQAQARPQAAAPASDSKDTPGPRDYAQSPSPPFSRKKKKKI